MIQIGRLSVHLDTREIFIDLKPVRVGSRAFDILEALIAADGALLTKEQILDRVWPDTVVEENNLQVHMSALRKLLGADRPLIKTIPGRGYRLLRQDQVDRADIVEAEAMGALTPTNLPAPVSILIGRDAVIDDVICAFAPVRLLSLVGAGGMGKTRLAMEVGRRLAPAYGDGVYLVSLASASDRHSVIDALAKALESRLGNGTATISRIISSLATLRILIILDNCEHVLPIAAELAEQLVQANACLEILTTSREPLRLANEQVFAVPPLPFPESDKPGDVALQCGAVQLFLARARAIEPSFSNDEKSIGLIGTVCRRLDGMPLAIELAASRAAVLGIQTLVEHLDDRFRMLTGGHRTALPRHQTLKATLDWSYALLSTDEQRTLRQLSIFNNGFTLSSATALMAMVELPADRVMDAVGGLVSKSLVVPVNPTTSMHATSSGTPPEKRYRLLETTRAYALQKLDDHGEKRLTSLNHACHMTALLPSVGELIDSTSSQMVRDTATMCELSSAGKITPDALDDIRAALHWAFSKHGDDGVGVALAAKASFYFFDRSLVRECCEWADRALQAIAHGASDLASDDTQRMYLLAALAAGHVYFNGPDAYTRRLWSEVCVLAAKKADRNLEARATWGLWNAAQYAGYAAEALEHANRFHALAEAFDDKANTVLGHRLVGIAQHFSGDQNAAQMHLQTMLSRYDKARHQLSLLGASIDHRIVGLATLARVVWLKGQREQAFSFSEEALGAATDYKHEMMICYVLVEACIPLALLSGRREQARAMITLLTSHADRGGFSIWNACAGAYGAFLVDMDDVAREQDSDPRSDASAIGTGRPAPIKVIGGSGGDDAIRFFHDMLERLEETGFMAHGSMLAAGYAMALAHRGDIPGALAEMERILARCMTTGDYWYSAELWRIKGEILQLSSESAGCEIDACLERALKESLKQGALSFQLRAATSIARRWHETRRPELVGDYLMPLCESITEGRHFDDYNAAIRLMRDSARDIRMRSENETGLSMTR